VFESITKDTTIDELFNQLGFPHRALVSGLNSDFLFENIEVLVNEGVVEKNSISSAEYIIRDHYDYLIKFHFSNSKISSIKLIMFLP